MTTLAHFDLAEIANKADAVRRSVVEVATRNGAGHIAPSLSCVDVLAALYYGVMRLDRDPQWDGRDRLVFSKGHGAYGLYAILADLGYVAEKDWQSFYKGSFLAGCVERDVEHGLEAGTGSLGHGLPLAVGIAWGLRMRGNAGRTFCIVGDGEMQEGSCWEAVQVAVRHRLGHLVTIIDANGLQAMDRLDKVLTPEGRSHDLRRKLEGFGIEIIDCDNHDLPELVRVLGAERAANATPVAVLAHTVKGYGIKAIEGIPMFHFRIPTAAEIAQGVRYG
ncbi:MAG TPA: transketolase [Planctomycetota bacterium]|nr:transketolase [Planctomycetota bacterium]